MKKKALITLLILFSLVGLIDAGYLTYQHYANIVPPCPANLPFFECGGVLTSKYATMWEVPTALLGVVYYAFVAFLALLTALSTKKIWQILTILFTTAGFLVSLYLVYLQLFVIGALCFYCMISAAISSTLFVLAAFLRKTN